MEGRFFPTLEKAHTPPPRPARSLPPRSVPLCAGRAITRSFATGLWARGPARVRPVKSLLRPWSLGGLRRIRQRGRARSHGCRYAPQGVEPPASRPRLPVRCPRPRVLTAAAPLREAQRRCSGCTGKQGLSGASACVIKRRLSGRSQLDSCW